MLNKIDSRLLNGINIQSNQKKPCIVKFNSLVEMYRYLNKHVECQYDYFSSIKSVAINLSIKDIYETALLNDVVYISSNTKVCAMVNVVKDIIGISEESKKTNFASVIIDTGLYPHIDIMLNSNVKILKFLDLISHKNVLYDDNGHGTFITTLMAGNGIVSGKKYKGVDNNVDLIIIKALDENGETSAVNILRAMQWVYDNRVRYNIKLACMSFGSNVLERNDPLIQGAEALWDSGVIVVSACGNSGPESGTIKSPSASSKIISVGALDDKRDGDNYDIDNFDVADFSSRGPILGNYKPDIIVSGVDVVSACNYSLHKKFYDKMSGTSVATPIVAGVVSRLIKKYPNHTPNQIKKILINNCRPITGNRNSEGYGWLDLHNVFELV